MTQPPDEREVSVDETPVGWGEDPDDDDAERLLAERPPHHDRG